MIYARFKKFIAIDTYPTLVNFAQSPLGKVVVLLVFAAPLYFLYDWWLEVMLTITAITFFPKYRRLWVLLGMLSLLMRGSWIGNLPFLPHAAPHHFINPSMLLNFLMVFLVSFILALLTQKYPQHKLLQRPVTILFAIMFIVIGIELNAPLNFMQKFYLWSFVLVFSHGFWFIAYTLHDCRTFKTRDFFYEYGR
jgi:hypothetical protein